MADNVLQPSSAHLISRSQRASLIRALFAWCRPSAVFRAVGTVVVDSVDAVLSGRLEAHIGEETFKGLAPLGAHGNTSTAVIRKARVSGICAALFHVAPRGILGSLGSSVSGCSLRRSFRLKTATTAVLTGSKIKTVCDAITSAIAAAIPSQLHATLSGFGDDNQSVKTTPNHLYSSPSHTSIINPSNCGVFRH